MRKKVLKEAQEKEARIAESRRLNEAKKQELERAQAKYARMRALAVEFNRDPDALIEQARQRSMKK